MKPDAAPQDKAAGTVRVRFQVQFSRGPKGQRRAREAEPSPETALSPSVPAQEIPSLGPKSVSIASIPRITRLLVLGYHFQRLVKDGVVRDYSQLAALTGLSRARITQTTNLTLLAPDLQEAILVLAETGTKGSIPCEAALRKTLATSEWTEQRRTVHSRRGSESAICRA